MRQKESSTLIHQHQFQSTHPSWGATLVQQIIKRWNKYFNPRTHRGVRPRLGGYKARAERFQSTHPSWGATRKQKHEQSKRRISIHAPIVGCDHFTPTHNTYTIDFNPRTHRGVRRFAFIPSDRITEFQSTHPSWGATILNG